MGVEQSKNSITMNKDGIKMRNGNKTISLTADGVYIGGDGQSMKMNSHELIETTAHGKLMLTNYSPTSTICINNECIQFDCHDRVKLRGGEIYCGEKLYYSHVNNHFVDHRS